MGAENTIAAKCVVVTVSPMLLGANAASILGGGKIRQSSDQPFEQSYMLWQWIHHHLTELLMQRHSQID